MTATKAVGFALEVQGQGIDYKTERSGKCKGCSIRFIFPSTCKRKLSELCCPRCGNRLAHTTNASRYAVSRALPLGFFG